MNVRSVVARDPRALSAAAIGSDPAFIKYTLNMILVYEREKSFSGSPHILLVCSR